MIPFRLPLRIKRNQSCYRVMDARERVLAFVYFEEDAGMRMVSPAHKWTSSEAQTIAKQIARSLIDAAR